MTAKQKPNRIKKYSDFINKRSRLTACLLMFLLFSIPLAAQREMDRQSITADSLILQDLKAEGIRFTDDNSVTLLPTGKAKFKDMFQAIRQAKKSIHLEYFNFRNDSIARALFVLLEQKASEGVEVRALFDDFGNASNNRPLRQKHLKELRDNGVEIYAFDPIRFPWVNHVFSRDHRKIVVIDGRVAYTGGMNVADYYIKGTPQVGSWHDMHCRIEGSAVDELQRIFIHTWNAVTRQSVQGQQYYRGLGDVSYFEELTPDTTTTAGRKVVGIINREPRISPAIIRQFYLSAINNARDSIKIINPYFTLNRALKKALKRAAKRGVKVEIMLSIRNDIPLTPDCGFYNAHKLMKSGCNIWLYKPGFHHTKIITVDGRLCTVGSANLNGRSLAWDREVNAVIADREITAQLDAIFARDKKQSMLLTPQSWEEFRTPWDKLRGWLAHLIAPLL